jgi:hypothetical protein
MANRATLIKRAIIVLGSPIALGYLLMKATARDPQKDLAVSSSNYYQLIYLFFNVFVLLAASSSQ